MTRTYELMTIYRPELSDEQAGRAANALAGALSQAGAEEVAQDFWGRRSLAYEIDHCREGCYAVITFRGEPEHAAVLDRNLSLDDSVLRHKIIRADEGGPPAPAEAPAPVEEKMSQ